MQIEDTPQASSTDSKRLWTRVEVSSAAGEGPTQPRSRPESISFGGVRWTNVDAHTNQHTHTHTRDEIIIELNMPTLSANVLGIFSRAHANSSPLHNGETSLLPTWYQVRKIYSYVPLVPMLQVNLIREYVSCFDVSNLSPFSARLLFRWKYSNPGDALVPAVVSMVNVLYVQCHVERGVLR